MRPRKNFKVILILINLLFFKSFLFGQTFPQKCEGQWQGMMYIWSHNKLVDSVQVNFTVEPISDKNGAWIWKTEYISEKMPMTKNYLLIEKDVAKGIYILDEGDGVILQNYVYGNKLYCLFQVDKIWLTSSYELVGDNLVFEVTSGHKLKNTSKGVKNYSFEILQRVVLTKLK